MEQPVNQFVHLSELEELEMAIANLRECQNKMKKEAYDPKKAQLIKEWLIDLYISRKRHPDYKPEPKKLMANKTYDGDILLEDPDLIDTVARTDFVDPFETFENSSEWKESATVRELLDGLTLMEYEAVIMVWLNGLGPTKAGYHMGCSARNVSTYLIRARAKMIAKLNSSSQMVLSGFDIPPTVRRHRKDSSTSKAKQKAKEHPQLTLF